MSAKKTALVPIANGSEEIEAITIIDTLRRAEIEVTVASVHDSMEVTCSRGVKIVADKTISECVGTHYDLVALPGGMPGATNLMQSKDLKDILSAQKDEGRLYAAICAAPAVVLAAHGFLDDRKATAYPAFQEKLKHLGEGTVVVDQNCITSQGPATALEFALTLVRELVGSEASEKVGKGMLFPYPG